MSTNPYQTPSVSDSAQKLPSGYWFRSTATLGIVVAGLLIFTAILTAGVGALDVIGYATIPGFATEDYEMVGLALNLTIAMVILGIASILFYLVTGIMFLVWMYRSTANAHALVAQGVEATPGWAVAYWFIPILFLFRPYQVTCEIYRASVATEPYGWQAKAVPGIFPAWWFCWIVGGIFDQIEMRSALRGWDLGAAALPISVGGSLLGVAGAVLSILVVRTITSAQQSRYEALRNQF